MKKLLVALRTLTEELMVKIEKNQILIRSANGIGLNTAEGFSYEDAQLIEQNFTAYKNESKQYWRDETKIVLPKRLFLKMVGKFFPNLFLFAHLSKETKTKLSLSRYVENATKETPHLVAGILGGLMYLFFAVLFLWLSIQPGFLPKIHTDGGSLTLRIVFFVLFLLLSLLFWAFSDEFFSHRKAIRRAKKNFPRLNGYDFFTSNIDQVGDCNTYIVFGQVPNYSVMMSKAISFKGQMGYLILKNAGMKGRLGEDVEIEIRYFGPLVPVILLKETIIFDTSFIDLFSEKDVFSHTNVSDFEFLLNHLKVDRGLSLFI